MKKILLIRPPEKYLPHRAMPMIYLPLGLLQIAAVLGQKGYAFDIIDGIMPYEGKINETGDNFFGITFLDLRQRIERNDFDIVGIQAQYTFQWPNALKTAQICKKINPDCTIIAGGAHISAEFENVLKNHNCIDVAVKGEGEYVLPALIERLRNNTALDGVPGVAYRLNNAPVGSAANVFIDDLDELPFPAYHLLDMEKYFWLAKKYFTRTAYEFPGWERGITLITSRGCPFNCIFCSIQAHMGREWRKHSAGYVLRHIEYLIKEFKVRYIHFEDDNFTLDSERCEEILDGIVRNKWGIRWDTPNGVRADTFNARLLRKCKASGCSHLIFGIESGVQRVLDRVIGKKMGLPEVEEVLKQAKEVGVDTRAFYMLGLPGETQSDIRASVKYALRLMWKYGCFGGFSMAVPLPGTKLYDICQEKGFFYLAPTIENLCNAYLVQGIIKTEEFGPDFLAEMRKYFLTRASFILFPIFFKKLLGNFYLLKYVIKNMLKTNPKNWPVIYYKVIFFPNALWFDMGKNLPPPDITAQDCGFCQGKYINLLFRAGDYISSKEFAVVRCRNCGLVYTYPSPTIEEIKRFYPDEYYDETKIRYNILARLFIRNLEAKRTKKILQNIEDKGAMLDIGCGRGWQLKCFRDKGWEVFGTELKEQSSSFARKELNLDVRVMDIRECKFKAEYFDVVTLWHTLEHLSQPFQALEEIYRILKREGLLILETPDFDSWQARISKEKWFHLDVPRHYCHFTGAMLEKMLKSAGFSIIKKEYSSLEYELYGALQSLFNISGISFNFLWDFLTQKSGKIKQMPKRELVMNVFFTLILAPVYVLLSAGIGLIAPIFKRGGVITIFARKP